MTTTAEIERALITALDTIRSNWAALTAPTPGGNGGGPKSADTITGLDRAISLRHETTLTLNGWARLIVEENQLTHHLPLGTDTLGVIEFLQRWARWFSGHDAGQAAADELRTLANTIHATANPTRPEWVSLGACPIETATDGTDDKCGGSVRAYPERDPECRRCGTTGSRAWWERVMFPDAETSDLMLEGDIATFIHRAFGGTLVKPSTVRQWVNRGVIHASGTDDKGRKLYSREVVIWAIQRRNAATAGQTV